MNESMMIIVSIKGMQKEKCVKLIAPFTLNYNGCVGRWSDILIAARRALGSRPA